MFHPMATEGEWRLPLVDQHLYYCCPTVIDGYTPCLISGHVSHTLWVHQIPQDMRPPGRRFRHQVKLLRTGYTRL